MALLVFAFINFGWLIFLIAGLWQFQSSRRQHLPLGKGVSLTLFSLAWVSAVVFLNDTVPAAREHARGIACQSNLKQLGLGIMQYTEDADGQMPPNLRATFPFVRSEALYSCPFGGTQCDPCYHDPEFPESRYRYSYRFLPGMLSQHTDTTAPIAWDNVAHPNLHLLLPFLGSRSRNVLALNGAIREMNEADFQSLMRGVSRSAAKRASRSSKGN